MAINVQLFFLVHIYATTCAHFLVKDIEPSMQKTLDLEADVSKLKIDLVDIEERLENHIKNERGIREHLCSFLVKDTKPSMQKILNLEADMSKVKINLADIEERLENHLNNERDQAYSAPTTTSSTTTTAACPHEWLRFQGSCYYFGDTPVNFTEAQNYCSKQGAYLVHIETEAENTFLKTFMLKNFKDKSRWIGMTDVQKEGVWMLTGQDTEAPFYDWYPGEPNDTDGGEDCAIVVGHAGYHFRWNDRKCETDVHILCEKRGK